MTAAPEGTLLAEIGGIRFRLLSGPPLAPPAPYYEGFLRPVIADPLAIELPLTVNEVPTGVPLPDSRVFTSGGPWSLAREGPERVIVFDPPALGGAAWCSARFPGDVSSVTVTTDGRIPFRLSYPLDQLLLMYRLATAGGLILHGAGFGHGGGGYAFLGVSGAGKTTLARLLLARGWDPLSDDRVIARPFGGPWHLFGTPWPGEGRIAVNAHLPLAGVFFLRHGRENWAVPLDTRRFVDRLCRVASIPWYDRELLPAVLDACNRLLGDVPAWELSFRPDPEAALFLEEFLGDD